MAQCPIHAGRIADQSKCAKCASCRHENAWRKVVTLISEPDYLLEDPIINRSNAERYAGNHREEPFDEQEWHCNGCLRRFGMDEFKGESWVLFNGSWVEQDKLITCGKCGTLFEAKRADAKYCSDTCRVLANRL